MSYSLLEQVKVSRRSNLSNVNLRYYTHSLFSKRWSEFDSRLKHFSLFFPSLIDDPGLIGASHDNYSKILGNSKKDKNHLGCSVACFINKGFSISSCSM